MIYTETPEWDLAEPALDEGYLDTAERILAMQAGPAHQAAMRWHRIAVQEGVLEQQFSYFWFALEIVAEVEKGPERVPSLCPRCRTALYCEQCQTHPVHRRYPGEAIQELVRRVQLDRPNEVFETLQRIRHTLMHGGRIADIADLPCSDQDAVNKLWRSHLERHRPDGKQVGRSQTRDPIELRCSRPFRAPQARRQCAYEVGLSR